MVSKVKYTIGWSRGHGGIMQCKNLTPRLLVARLYKAIRNSGSITVHEITRDKPELEKLPEQA